MKLEPVISEKSLNLAKSGKYTFHTDPKLNKFQIKNLIETIFKVHVTQIATIHEHGETKKTAYGRKKTIKPGKKAIVTLKDKEKIDIFEVKEK
jgi:ribosomal protein L23